MKTIKKLLIIPDAHAHPKYSNERFTWLRKFIDAEKPEAIVCLGDFADMPSLSKYDVGKASFENRRYVDDIVAARDANERLGVAVRFRGRKPRGARARRSAPGHAKYMLLGNHEHRIVRAANDDPKLKGFLKINNLGYEDFGWKVYGYRSTLTLGGITFSHDFPTGISGKTIGGENIARTLITKNLTSSVQGHSHVFDHSERTRIDGTKLFGLSAGCYVHPNMVEDWNINTAHMWWRGVVVLDRVAGGYYDKLTAITMREIQALYG